MTEVILEQSPTGEEELKQQFSDPDTERKRLQNERLQEDNRQSQKYCKRAYKITKIWLWFLIIVITAQFVLEACGHGLREKEFIAVIVTLTGSVFGFWYLVGKYLFNPQNGNQEKGKTLSKPRLK